MNKIFISATFAGVLISIGCKAYINVGPILGPFLFAIGILSILHLKLHLFTGKIPYISNYKEVPEIVAILIGNMLGCNLMWLFPSNTSISIINNKLNENLLFVFIEAILCNILIYIAVEAYKKQDVLTIVLAIATFILAGFEHSIANMCYIISARVFNFKVLIFIIVVIIGNTIGGLLAHNIHKRVNK